jgi:hypothetical protein
MNDGLSRPGYVDTWCQHYRYQRRQIMRAQRRTRNEAVAKAWSESLHAARKVPNGIPRSRRCRAAPSGKQRRASAFCDVSGDVQKRVGMRPEGGWFRSGCVSRSYRMSSGFNGCVQTRGTCSDASGCSMHGMSNERMCSDASRAYTFFMGVLDTIWFLLETALHWPDLGHQTRWRHMDRQTLMIPNVVLQISSRQSRTRANDWPKTRWP